MKNFKTVILSISLFASSTYAVANENISLRIGFVKEGAGLKFSPLRAETGAFSLTPSQPEHSEGPSWRVLAKDSNNNILHEVTVQSPEQSRVEVFDRRTKKIKHAKTLQKNTGVFEVSMPFSSSVTSIEVLPVQNTSTTLQSNLRLERADRLLPASGSAAKFDRATLEKLINPSDRKFSSRFDVAGTAAAVTASPTATLTTVLNSGSSDKKMDFVFVGDGYTAAQMSKWRADAKKIMDGVMADPLFAANRSAINMHRVDVVSKQSGIDEVDKRIYKDTAMDGVIGCFNDANTICVNDTKVRNIIGSVLPADARDVILVVSNTTRDAGAASGNVAIFTLVDPVDTALHEIGHAAFGLADEYGGTNTDCTRSTLEPTDPNVSRNATRKVKWGSFIASSTVVPTPVGKYPNGTVGVFQGGEYCDKGKYRPTENSRMRDLSQPWHAVNESLARKAFDKHTKSTISRTVQAGIIKTGESIDVPIQSSQSPGYIQAADGYHDISLSGSASRNFILELYKWQPNDTWIKVASNTKPALDKVINYKGTAGYYYATVTALSGSGVYTVRHNFPRPQ